MQQAWAKTQQEFAKAQSEHQTASNRLQQARRGAAQKSAADLGVTTAVTERDAASRQINSRRNAIEKEIKTRSDYQTAEKETDEARARLIVLPEDKSLTDEQRENLGKELSAKIRRPTEMRKQLEAKDPEMLQALQHREAALKKIAELQPKLKKAIDSDPAVSKATEQEKQAASALEKARNAAARTELDFNTAQTNLDRQNQQLQAAIAQSHYRKHR
jgi:chromosome segregation ATPase